MSINALAVVIPAYKAKYFYESLESLSHQTNKNFNVYIGDDNSPEDLKSIVEIYSEKLFITYKRFDNNLGGKDLVGQWTRCIGLTKDEKWLWLFSDDDIAEENCVEQFYGTIERANGLSDVYRFNTIVIDSYGVMVSSPPESPAHESSIHMAYQLLLGKRGNSIVDHIFSRSIFEKTGGFVHTDYAQAADWATSIKFSQGKGMTIIPNAKVYWRKSGENVSSIASSRKSKMLHGHLQFIRWILSHFNYLKTTPENGISYSMMQKACRENLIWIIRDHYKGYLLKDFLLLYLFFKRELGLSSNASMKELYYLKLQTNKPLSQMAKPFHMLKGYFNSDSRGK